MIAPCVWGSVTMFTIEEIFEYMWSVERENYRPESKPIDDLTKELE